MKQLTKLYIVLLQLPLYLMCSINLTDISLSKSYVQVDAPKPLLSQRISLLRNYTTDFKCKHGLDIGVSFRVSKPYVGKNTNTTHLELSGIFPNALDPILEFCCPSSKISYGKQLHSTYDVYKEFDGNEEVMDITFPVTAQNGARQSTDYRGFPFVSIAEAPKIILLVPDRILQERNTRTAVLMSTIMNTWPMLIFIIVSAMLSGLILWSLDRKKNPKEFPMNFFSGAWEGIWWAFVTMTTVGYGDRSPKSPYARAFCIIWILLGIILISLFTGLVSASLSVSSTPVFNIAGAKIGAVYGSLEYEFGVGLNAEMKRYDTMEDMMKGFLEKQELDGVLIDNFILSSHQETLKTDRLRIEREFNHPVPYGFVLGKGASETEKCLRRYTRIYTQKVFDIIQGNLFPVKKVFDIIQGNLFPVKNPTDGVRVEVEAAEKLFYEEYVFKVLVCTETGLLVAAFLFGTVWEVHVMNKDSAAYRFIGRFRNRTPFEESPMHEIVKSDSRPEHSALLSNSGELQALLSEYDDYHNTWVTRVRNLQGGT